MRHLMTSALAGALLAALPGAAAAQPTVPPSIYCVPGATNACFAAALASSGESATLWLQNLQGTFTPNPAPFTIGGVMVQRVSETNQFVWAPSTEPGPWLAAEGAVFTYTTGWQFSEDSFVDLGPDQRRWYTTQLPDLGLAGCSFPFSNPEALFFGWRTCVRDGENGWMRLDFTAFITGAIDAPGHGAFVRELTLADVNLTVGDVDLGTGCTIIGANSGAAEGFRPACLASPYDLTSVPEPATVALLASGLVALGGIGAARRRS